MRTCTTRVLAVLGVSLLMLSGCSATTNPKTVVVAQPGAVVTQPAPVAAQPSAQQLAFVQEASSYPGTKLEPNVFNGPVGTRLVLTGTGYPASQDVAITWSTFDGRWLLEQEEVVFVGPRYDEKIIDLGKAKTGNDGAFRFEYTVPEDFGGLHDIVTRVGGKYATKTAFSVTPSFSVSATSGPIGTPVIIKATGIGYKQQLAQWEIAWDNGFTGYMTAVTTRGTATANVRMAGPVGTHVLKIWRNYRGIPYLNPHQGPFGKLPESTFIMNVTEGVHQAPAMWEHPKSVDTVRPTPRPNSTGGGTLSLSSDKGTVGSKIAIRGGGFAPNQPVKMSWATRTGQKIMATGLMEGFDEQIRDLPNATADKDGKFAVDWTVFDDYAGYHRITAESGSVKAEAYYSVYGNISQFKDKVKVGEPVNIRLRGIGWNIQGKTYGVVFDNKYLGYICSFSTKGYIELDLPPIMTPGTHIIDLYPAVYEGQDPTPNIYSSPNLTYQNDHPGGALPAFRLTLTVTE